MAMQFTKKIGDYLRNRGVKVNDRTKRIGQVLRTAGIPVTKENLQKYKGQTAKDVFQQLKDNGKLGDKRWLDYAANNPNLYQKATQKYNLKYGAPSGKQLENFQENADQKASDYYAPDQEHLNSSKDESLRRYQEDYGLTNGQLDTNYQRNVDNINTNKGYLGENYQRQLAQDALTKQLENEGIQGDVNSLGQFDSGIGQQKLTRLAQQQDWRNQGINTNYNRANTGYDTSLSQLGQDNVTNQQTYQRNYDRNIYDVNDLYNTNQRNLDRSQQGYSDQLLSGKISDIANNSNQYYGNQQAADAEADNALNDLYQTQ